MSVGPDSTYQRRFRTPVHGTCSRRRCSESLRLPVCALECKVLKAFARRAFIHQKDEARQPATIAPANELQPVASNSGHGHVPTAALSATAADACVRFLAPDRMAPPRRNKAGARPARPTSNPETPDGEGRKRAPRASRAAARDENATASRHRTVESICAVAANQPLDIEPPRTASSATES